jgi:hypothetical protein
MKILTNIIILIVSLLFIAPMIYFFLSTFFNADLVFFIAIFCAVAIAIIGFKVDNKKM